MRPDASDVIALEDNTKNRLVLLCYGLFFEILLKVITRPICRTVFFLLHVYGINIRVIV